MAALTVVDAVVVCNSGIVTEVAPSGATTRVGGLIQNQSDTRVRVRLGADPSATVGYVLEPGDERTYGTGVPGNGNNTDNYQGDVRVFNPGPKPVEIYRIEAST